MKTRRHQRRSGSILVLSVFVMFLAIAVLAFAVDLGHLQVARTQLQRSADSAALAAAWELIDPQAPSGWDDPYSADYRARQVAGNFSMANLVSGDAPALDYWNDVQVGYLANSQAEMTFVDPTQYNAVRVMVRRTHDQNGEVPLFFARVLGLNSAASSAEAIAMFFDNVRGFTNPTPGTNLGILPFAFHEDKWNQLMAEVRAQSGTDNWTYDPGDPSLDPPVPPGVTAGWDGVPEVNLYPQDQNTPGNTGTVDVGSANNSTAAISRQITDGVTSDDLSYHGGSLELGEDGTLLLNGDTGISAGVKDELVSIIGEPRVLPIYSTVVNPGNNAQYTIVGFVGVRIMEVDLTGSMSTKRVIIQPANISMPGAIPDTGNTQRSEFVFSPVYLVR